MSNWQQVKVANCQLQLRILGEVLCFPPSRRPKAIRVREAAGAARRLGGPSEAPCRLPPYPVHAAKLPAGRRDRQGGALPPPYGTPYALPAAQGAPVGPPPARGLGWRHWGAITGPWWSLGSPARSAGRRLSVDPTAGRPYESLPMRWVVWATHHVDGNSPAWPISAANTANWVCV
jgi:hypothetical protein